MSYIKLSQLFGDTTKFSFEFEEDTSDLSEKCKPAHGKSDTGRKHVNVPGKYQIIIDGQNPLLASDAPPKL